MLFTKRKHVIAYVALSLAVVFSLSCGGGCQELRADSDFPYEDLATSQTGPQWSTDGQLIVFGHAGGVYSVRSDGSDLRLLAGNPLERDYHAHSPSISPGGTRIAYAAFRHGSWLPWRTEYGWDIVTSKLDGSERRRLTRNGEQYGLHVNPVWSPDGTRIAFASNRDGSRALYTMAADGSDIRNVAPSVPALAPVPVWSPDGRHLAFVGNGSDSESSDKGAGLYTVGADGSGLKRVAEAGRVGPYDADNVPAWPPDGNRIAFVRHDDELKAIMATDPDGSNLSVVFDYADLFPSENRPLHNLSWSPDGSKLLFSSYGGHIGVVNSNGSNAQLLTHLRHQLERATWSPAGSRILVQLPSVVGNNSRTTGAPSDAPVFDVALFTMDADGTNKRIVARHERDSGRWTGKVIPVDGMSWHPDFEQLPDHGPQPSGIDLLLKAKLWPLAVSVESPFLLTIYVKNVGERSSEASTLRYYLSSDSTIDPSDEQVGTNHLRSLYSVGSPWRTAEEVEVALTAPAVPGIYFYGACVDAMPDETDSTNNCSGGAGLSVRVSTEPPEGIADITATLGEWFQIDLSRFVRGRNGAEVFDYGFILTPRGIVDGFVQTKTGLLTLSADAVGTTFISVTARDSHGNGAEFDVLRVTVLPAPTAGEPAAPTDLTATPTALPVPQHDRPGAPTDLTATTVGSSRIDLSWNAPSDDGGAAVTGYRIEVSPDGSGWSDLWVDTPFLSTSTTHSNTGLSSGRSQCYRVSAINSAGTGPPSNIAKGTTE